MSLFGESKNRFVNVEFFQDGRVDKKSQKVYEVLKNLLKKGVKYMIVVDDWSHRYKELPTFRLPQLEGRVSQFLDWNSEQCADLSQQCKQLSKSSKPWCVYTNKQGMIGVDFAFPEEAHVICALELKSVAEYVQILGRGVRRAGKSTQGTLILSTKFESKISLENF